ncbi:hypothetical protein M3J09_006425 [Ascochyta lentis]
MIQPLRNPEEARVVRCAIVVAYCQVDQTIHNVLVSNNMNAFLPELNLGGCKLFLQLGELLLAGCEGLLNTVQLFLQLLFLFGILSALLEQFAVTEIFEHSSVVWRKGGDCRQTARTGDEVCSSERASLVGREWRWLRRPWAEWRWMRRPGRVNGDV